MCVPTTRQTNTKCIYRVQIFIILREWLTAALEKQSKHEYAYVVGGCFVWITHTLLLYRFSDLIYDKRVSSVDTVYWRQWGGHKKQKSMEKIVGGDELRCRKVSGAS